MKIKQTDARDGMVILTVEDDRGDHEIALHPLDTEDLIGALQVQIQDATGQPAAHSRVRPGIQRVSYVQTPETLFFRVYLNDRIFHEYPVDANTTLADALRVFADVVEAQNLAKTTHQPPEGPSGKN